jgi:hypothetical protein
MNRYRNSILVFVLCFTFTNGFAQDSLNVRWIGQIYLTGDIQGVAHTDNYLYVVAITSTNQSRLSVFDVSDPNAIQEVGQFDSLTYAYGIAVSGQYVYITDNFSLRVVDMSNPNIPILAGSLAVQDDISKIAISDSLAFVIGVQGMRIINISDPQHPVETGCYVTNYPMQDVAVSNRCAYTTFDADNYSGMSIIDLSNLSSPFEAGNFHTFFDELHVAIRDSIVYLTVGNRGLMTVNVSDPAAPTEIDFVQLNGFIYDLAVSGNFAYMATALFGLQVVDITDPTHLHLAGFYHSGDFSYRICVSDRIAFVSAGNLLNMYDCSSVSVITEGSHFQPSTFSLTSYPNPFNPTTSISFDLPKPGLTTLNVYNLLGQSVAELVNKQMEAGHHQVEFDGSGLASGVYICTLQAGSFNTSRKMMLMK